jgi:aminoglycoside phosphotransferase family enzyme/predicted kinase
VIEYAVKLRLLPERYFLNQLIKRGALASRHLDRVSARLRRFYQSQHPTKSIESWGRIRRLRISTDENFRQLKPFVAESSPNEPAGENRSGESGLDPITLSPAAYKTLRFYTDQYYRHHAQLFASRIRAHRIRDCHGDLHLDHIHLTPRALNIYDCIEFNDRLRYVDVANDAAFLAMDLDFQGRPDLARHFADRMAKELKDDGMPILMDFYKCYRAVVRGKVESLHSVSHSSSKRERRSATKTARRYFQLALQYAVAGSRPSILAVSGRIGTGKSTLARALGTELGWPVMSSDTIRKRLAGVPLHHRGSPAARNRLYSSEMTERTYTRLLSMAEAKLLKSRGVILDATFGKREQRELLAEHSRHRGIAWTILEAQASDAVVRRRLRARDSMAGVVSDARIDDFKKLTEHYEPPHEVPKGCLAKVRTTGRIDQTVVQALRNLACLRISAAGS